MALFGIVSSSRMFSHGRWDASFLLLDAKHADTIKWLKQVYTAEQRSEIASCLPVDRDLLGQLGHTRTNASYSSLSEPARIVYLAAYLDSDAKMRQASETHLQAVQETTAKLTSLACLISDRQAFMKASPPSTE